MKTFALSLGLMLLSFSSLAAITECPRMVSYSEKGRDVFWTKDVLVPRFNTMSMSYRINGKYFEEGLFAYKKAERACSEVTKACAGTGLTFRVPTIPEWKSLIQRGHFDDLDHPAPKGRGYWASDKSYGFIAFGPMPAYGPIRGVVSISTKKTSFLDAGALMAAKCIATK